MPILYLVEAAQRDPIMRDLCAEQWQAGHAAGWNHWPAEQHREPAWMAGYDAGVVNRETTLGPIESNPFSVPLASPVMGARV